MGIIGYLLWAAYLVVVAGVSRFALFVLLNAIETKDPTAIWVVTVIYLACLFWTFAAMLNGVNGIPVK